MGSSNVYTVLMLIAALMLVAAIVFVVMRNGELYGNGPFDPTAALQNIWETARTMRA